MITESPRILVVEDEEALLDTIRDEFEAQGFAVDPALTGEEALRKLEERPPDAVILDLLLSAGGVDGLGVLARMKESEQSRDIPVLFLSNVGDDEHIRSALDLGADAYFVKTRHQISDLVDRLRSVLSERRRA